MRGIIILFGVLILSGVAWGDPELAPRLPRFRDALVEVYRSAKWPTAQQVDRALRRVVHDSRFWHPVIKKESWRTELRDAFFEAAEMSQIEDPLLLVAIGGCESSLLPGQKGGIGEVGIMQVAPRNIQKHCGDLDMTKGRDSIVCGARILRISIDMCGDIPNALAYYGTGKTCDWPRKDKDSRLHKMIKKRIRWWAALRRIAFAPARVLSGHADKTDK